MPTRKQRRRDQKARRHDYEYVYVDDDGNEVDVDPDDVERPAKPARPKARAAAGVSAKSAKGRPARDSRGRPIRAVPPPTWQRSVKRAAIVAVLMFGLISIMQKNSALPTKVMIAGFYGLLFVPMSFMLDRTMYRNYLRRSGQPDERSNGFRGRR